MDRTFNLADLFETVAAVVPDRTALICGPQRLSYAELDARASRLAAALAQRGIGRGCNVGIQLVNSAEYLETFLACCKIGAAPVNVNYRYVAAELEHLFTTLDLAALVYGAAFAGEVQAVASRVPTLRWAVCVGATSPVDTAPANGASPPVFTDYEALLSSAGLPASAPGREARRDDDLYILCTGGTTGKPKGVMWPHRHLFFAALGGGGLYFGRPPIARPEELAEFVPQGPPLRYFAAAPMMHGAAMWASLISLLAGHTVVVNDQPVFEAAHVWSLIEREGVNIVSIVGDAMAQPLVEALEAHPGRWDLSRLRVFGNGGAVFSRHLQDRLHAVLPGLTFNNGMGSSESGLVGGGQKVLAPGQGLVHIAPRPDLAVVDDDLRFLTRPGEEGVLARTGAVPIGYYGDPEQSARTFVRIEGRPWVLTGDRARIDEDGGYVVLGRGSLCINTGGEKVFPEEVEEAARQCAGVADVMVVGLPSPRWGQEVTAVVQMAPGQVFDAAAFRRACRAELAGYKVPKRVVLAESLKRSPAGKADYTWARAAAEGGVARGQGITLGA